MDTVGQVIRMPNLRDGYLAIVKAVAEHGKKVSPRGQSTFEFEAATLIIEDPFDTLPVGVGRGIVPGIAAVESAQLLGGVSDPQLTIAVSPAFSRFTEDNGLFHGAYGPRTARYEQFAMVERRLKSDQFSRQAVVTIWQPEFDTLDEKRDYPCTLLYHFMIRGSKLIMETVMRSNDVILGLGYDAFQHSRVQIAMASCLGIEPGEYRHHAMSLHLYERDLDKVSELTTSQRAPEFQPALMGSNWDEVSRLARVALYLGAADDDPEWDDDADPSFRWYVDSIRAAVARNKEKEGEE